MVSSILSSGADRGGEKETISQSQGTGRVSAVYRPFLPESLNEQINRAKRHRHAVDSLPRTSSPQRPIEPPFELSLRPENPSRRNRLVFLLTTNPLEQSDKFIFGQRVDSSQDYFLFVAWSLGNARHYMVTQPTQTQSHPISPSIQNTPFNPNLQ
jgi:hypothetical protein